MKEDKITKRIKELQEDSRFTFKLTDDVIALVYRTAVEDLSKEKKDTDKVYKDDEVVIASSKELNKKFGSKETTYTKEQLKTEIQNNIQKTKRCKIFRRFKIKVFSLKQTPFMNNIGYLLFYLLNF